MSCKVNGSFTLNDGSTFNLQDNSSLTSDGELKLNSGSTLNVNNSSEFLSYGELNLSEGVIINLQYTYEGDLELKGVIKSIGSTNENVTINCSTGTGWIKCINVDTLLMQHTIINSGSVAVHIMDGIQKPRLLSISHSIFNNSPLLHLFYAENTEGVNIQLADNSFSTSNQNNQGLYFSGFNNIQLIRDTIQSTITPTYLYGPGIYILNNKSTEINECYISNFNYGIQRGSPVPEELENLVPTYSEDIKVSNCSLNGGQNNTGAGILTGTIQDYQVSGVKIDLNNISNFRSGIIVSNSDNFPLGIKNNTITNYAMFGISLAGGNDAVIKENYISTNEATAENAIGIYLGLSANPKILSNTINAEGVTNPGTGIFSVSSDGEIRNNTIQHHWHGIELGSSSPNVGANTITTNLRYGIFINDHSYPDLSEQIVGGDPYPLSGYNTIRENGECNFLPSYSELYLRFNSTVNLEKGCNTIADDREDPALHCNYFYLIDGSHVAREVNAVRNYWGEVNRSNPEGRFGGGLIVDYSDWQIEPCTYDEGGGILILANSKGEVYDTVYVNGEAPLELTDIELRYSAANEYYYNNNYSQAKQEYESIIQDYGDSTESLQAYNRLYTLANLMYSSPETFNQLKDYFLQKASNQTDSILIGTLTHLADLCLVSATEYVAAINNFDEIAQQNPNTDIALYRQIDALTTSLLMPQDSSLNKGVLGKYSVSDLSEYNNKLSELLQTRGKSIINSDKELLPIEYTLYQNYPNPFNPTTTIKYDLPFASEVSLCIYDILGRKVKELVNTRQPAGRYEVQFDATSLSSGVYIYQLIAEKYMSSKKMILLK